MSDRSDPAWSCPSNLSLSGQVSVGAKRRASPELEYVNVNFESKCSIYVPAQRILHLSYVLTLFKTSVHQGYCCYCSEHVGTVHVLLLFTYRISYSALRA